MQAPFSYEEINLSTSVFSPSTVHVSNSEITRFYKKYLVEEVFSRFKFTLPEEWDSNYFLYTLFCCGFSAIFDTDAYGVINQHCGLEGRNIYYQPTHVLISNPLIRTMRAKIGTECALVKLQPNYSGIMDIVSYYANMLALCVEAAQINLLNSHVAYVFAAPSKTKAESYKKLYDSIAKGNPAVFADSSLFDEQGRLMVQMMTQNVGQNYIVDKLLNDMQHIRKQFLTDIGIPNANTEKRERMIVDEANANNFETEAKASLWLETIREGFDQANRMYNLNLAVELRREEVGSYGDSDSIGPVQL